MVDPFATPPADEAQATPEPEPTPEPPEEPFAAPPPEETAEAPKKAPAKAAPKKAVGTVSVDVKPNLLPFDADGKVVLTFKGGTGYDAPWIVIHAKDLDDAFDQVAGENAAKLAEIMERVQIAGKHFAGLAPAKPNSAGAPAQAAPAQRQAAPQEAQGAPGGEQRYCSHGAMKFVSQISKKTGKPYSAFFCNSGDRNDECKAQFLR